MGIDAIIGYFDRLWISPSNKPGASSRKLPGPHQVSCIGNDCSSRDIPIVIVNAALVRKSKPAGIASTVSYRLHDDVFA